MATRRTKTKPANDVTPARAPAATLAHTWGFRAKFRRGAFGWKSQPAITRVRQAVAEIKKVAKRDPVLAGEGAVLFIERVSPALQNVDSSSGAIGSAVNHAIAELSTILADAPADRATRGWWLERLHEAHANDEIPYIEALAEHWGELCASKELASEWADKLLGITKNALSQDKSLRGHFHGTPMCLTALYRAERYEELLSLLEHEKFWSYKRWAVKALAAMGKKMEAVALAQESRGPWTSETDVARLCEEILLSLGHREAAFAQHAAIANRAGTYLAWFRAVAKKYPERSKEEVLALLVASTPGDEGKWFAAAKDAKLLVEALGLAMRYPTDPRTLARAARDFADTEPQFAIECGMLGVARIAEGYGFDITGADVWAAYSPAKKAADRLHITRHVRAQLRGITSRGGSGAKFVADVLRSELHDA